MGGTCRKRACKRNYFTSLFFSFYFKGMDETRQRFTAMLSSGDKSKHTIKTIFSRKTMSVMHRQPHNTFLLSCHYWEHSLCPHLLHLTLVQTHSLALVSPNNWNAQTFPQSICNVCQASHENLGLSMVRIS